ncbi:MAG: hypothetical protein Q7S66_04920 [bacterium]|nr:hypothetical protein [bacterium]
MAIADTMPGTLTKVATSSITWTKLAVATAAVFLAGGSAYAGTVLLQKPDLKIQTIVFDNSSRKVAVTVVNIGDKAMPTNTTMAVKWSNFIAPTTPAVVSAVEVPILGIASSLGTGLRSNKITLTLDYPTGFFPTRFAANVNPTRSLVEYSFTNNVSSNAVPTMCTDSDGGANKAVPGSTTGCNDATCGSVVTVSDCCKAVVSTSGGSTVYSGCQASGTVVAEGSCNYHGIAVNNVPCADGCSNGACLPPVQYSCTDSDGGFQPNRAGIATETNINTGQSASFSDRCINLNTITDYICVSNRVTSTVLGCFTSGGFSCQPGAGACAVVPPFPASSTPPTSTSTPPVATSTPPVAASYPVFTKLSTNNARLANGTEDLYKFSIEAVNDDIALYAFTFLVTSTRATVSNLVLYDVTAFQERQLNSTLGSVHEWHTVGTDWGINFPSNEIIVSPGASIRTFVLRGNISGADTGASASTRILGDTREINNTAAEVATLSNFVWSDMRRMNHSVNTADWMSGFGVRGWNSSSIETIRF